MHPIFESQMESDVKEVEPPGNTQGKQEDSKNVDALEQSLERSPYNITVNSNKYRRSRQMTGKYLN